MVIYNLENTMHLYLAFKCTVVFTTIKCLKNTITHDTCNSGITLNQTLLQLKGCGGLRHAIVNEGIIKNYKLACDYFDGFLSSSSSQK